MTDCPNSLRSNCVSSCSEWLHWRVKLTEKRETHSIIYIWGQQCTCSVSPGRHSQWSIYKMCVWLAKSILETEDKSLYCWPESTRHTIESAVCFNIRVDNMLPYMSPRAMFTMIWNHALKLRKMTNNSQSQHDTLILKCRWTANWGLSIITTYGETILKQTIFLLTALSNGDEGATAGGHSYPRKEFVMCPHRTERKEINK